MRRIPNLSLTLIAVVLIGWSVSAGADNTLRIVAPTQDTLLTGPTRLKAELLPPVTASKVVFFANGREVCTTNRPPFECAWDAGPVITEHLIRVVASLADGTRLVQTVRTKGLDFTERVDVDVVQVTVTVVDEDGRYVKGLPRSAFHVSEDGRPQPLTHFYAENVPLDLVVAIDASGSMSPVMATLKQAVAAFLGAVPPRHRVTLLGFNDNVFPLARHENDPAARIKAVDRLTSWGGTVLYEALLEGIAMLGAQSGRKALVAFTDGDDQGSLASLADVEDELQASDLTLYMIGQGRATTTPALRQTMERLARATGGRAFFAERIEQLSASFTALLEELSNQYVLGYQPTNMASDGKWRQIAVTVDGQHRARARHGYRAKSPQTTAMERR